MTVRNDITVNWNLTPRIVTVASPSTTVTIQDLVDTLRDIEDELQNIDEPHLIEAGGKESLGGAVQVGITATLQNARVAFQASKESTCAGTVTTEDADGLVLTDATASFVSDSVEIGAWASNITDGSIATVMRVISETSILTDRLGGGDDNAFAAGDRYQIRNVRQCLISGGNLVAVDEDDAPSSPVLPTAGVHVVLSASTSASLVSSVLSGTEYETRAILGAVLDGSTLRLDAWLVREGTAVTAPVAASVALYDSTGALVVSQGLGTPDARGTFHAALSAVTLAANRNYRAEVTITDADGSRTDVWPIQTLDSPDLIYRIAT